MVVRLKRRREQMQLSQRALAERVGISRQALGAIEGGRQNPSVTIALALASALQCRVEELFALDEGDAIEAEIVDDLERPAGPWPQMTARVAVGEVAGRFVAHRLDGIDYSAADGLLINGSEGGPGHSSGDGPGDEQRGGVELFAARENIAGNLLVAGCAPLLSTLERSVGERFADVRMRWLRASSERALSLLAERRAHIAGIHLVDQCAADDNAAVVRARFGRAGALLVNLISWRQGLVVARGNPLGLSVADLARPGLRLVWREAGASARQLLARALARAGVRESRPQEQALAGGHIDVARAVAAGAADVGVAIEAAAVAFELDFIPLSQERFDLVISASDADRPALRRLLDVVDSSAFRAQASAIGGYSTALTGHATRVADDRAEVSR